MVSDIENERVEPKYRIGVAVSSNAYDIERIQERFCQWYQNCGPNARSQVTELFAPIRHPPDVATVPSKETAEAALEAAISTWHDMSPRLIGWAFAAKFALLPNFGSASPDECRNFLRKTLSRARQEQRLGSPVAILALPHSIAEILMDALQALEHGEAQGLFQPKRGPRRRMAYTLSGLEQTAIVLVGWRYGEGGTKRQAMEAVAHAYGVSFDTVRQWERKYAGRDLDLVARSALAAARAKGLDRASALRRSKASFAKDNLRYNNSISTRDEWEGWRWRQARRDAKAWAKVDLNSVASQYKAAKMKAKTGAR